MSAHGIDATEAVAAWEADLAGASNVQDELAELAAWQREHDFGIHGHIVDSVARPRIITPDGARWLARDAELVLSALETIERAVLEQPERWTSLVGAFDDEQRELLEMPALFSHANLIVRLDGTWTEDGVVFYELNGSIPAGVETTQLLGDVIASSPTFRRVSQAHSLQQFDLRGGATETILAAWRRFGGEDEPRMAIVDFLDEVKVTTFHVMSEWMQEREIDCQPVDARDLVFDGEHLRHGDERIDLVYRRLTVADMLGRPEETRALRAAARANAMAMVDPFPVSVLDRKALFAPLSVPEVLRDLSSAEREAAVRCVPWTRLLQDERTAGPDGREVDLIEFARANRERLVLKPNHDMAGHGVHIGPAMTQPEWDAAIEEAQGGEWVVQRGVQPARARYPRLDDPTGFVELEESTDSYLFGGRFGGILTRLSPSGPTNIKAGAATTGVFVAGD